MNSELTVLRFKVEGEPFTLAVPCSAELMTRLDPDDTAAETAGVVAARILELARDVACEHLGRDFEPYDLELQSYTTGPMPNPQAMH